MNGRNILVFDFETAGKLSNRDDHIDPEQVVPIQVACVALDPRKLEVIPGSAFETMMRPPEGTELQDSALKVNKKTREQIWAAPADWGTAWKRFAAHVKKFSDGGKPIPAGKNIRSFDLPIARWLSQKFGLADKSGNTDLFHTGMTLDLEDYVWHLYEDSNELPSRGRDGRCKMDDMRPYFGLTDENSHDAMVDVLQTAALVHKFQKLFRNLMRMKTKSGDDFIRLKGCCEGFSLQAC